MLRPDGAVSSVKWPGASSPVQPGLIFVLNVIRAPSLGWRGANCVSSPPRCTCPNTGPCDECGMINFIKIKTAWILNIFEC